MLLLQLKLKSPCADCVAVFLPSVLCAKVFQNWDQVPCLVRRVPNEEVESGILWIDRLV